MLHEDIQVSLTLSYHVCILILKDFLINEKIALNHYSAVLDFYRHIQIVLEIIEYFKIYGQTIKQ